MDNKRQKGASAVNKELTLGLIGAGRIGKLHAENIVRHIKGVRIKAVSDLYADSIRPWAAEIGIGEVTTDYRAILADPAIDAVLICSSTDTHARIIIEAAQAGKHIFCEKPVDFDVPTIKKALAAVAAAGVKLQIGFNRRFDHNFRKVREMVAAGAVGQPHIIKITSRDPAPPPLDYVKVSGGLFLDMTIHDFDMARFLAGSEVTEVSAVAGVLVDPQIGAAGDVDTAIVTLKFANGAIGVIDNSRKAAYGYDQRVEVFGSLGCVATGNDSPTAVQLSNAAGVTGDKPLYFFLERYKDAYIAEINEFIDAVRHDRQPSVTGDDGLQPVLIGLAAKRAAAEGRRVKVGED